MKRTLAAVLAAASALGAAAASAQTFQLPWPFGPAQQPYPGQQQPYYGNRSGPSITFYEGENFSGRAVTVFGEEEDLNRLGFNDRARSAQTNGSFLVCEHVEFRGRCERLTGSVRDLDRYDLAGRISSAREDRYGGGYGQDRGYEDEDDRYDRPGRGYGNPRRDGVEGRSVTFFSRPSAGGADLAARGQGSADQFCRASGLGGAVYWSQGERSRRAVDTDGRLVDAPILRDVLCRNR